MPKLKRYLVFEFYSYEANGGFGDFVGSYDTPEELQAVYSRGIRALYFRRDADARLGWHQLDNLEIIDCETGDDVTSDIIDRTYNLNELM